MSRSLLFSWRLAIRDSGLGSTARLVAWALSNYMDTRGGSAFPGVERLAADTATSRSTVKRALNELRERGWLVVVESGGGRGRATEYRAAVPKEVHTELVSSEQPVQIDTETGPSATRNRSTHDPPPSQGTSQELATRDSLFESVAEVCGIDWTNLTKSARGSLNRAVADLRAVGATPGEVVRRAANYRQHFRDAPLTPPALAKHWPMLDDGPRASTPASWAAIEEAAQ